MGLIVPPPGAGVGRKLRGVAIVLGLVLALLVIGFLLAQLIALPFGGVGIGPAIFYGLLIVLVALGVLVLLGRRRQKTARAKAAAARAG